MRFLAVATVLALVTPAAADTAAKKPQPAAKVAQPAPPAAAKAPACKRTIVGKGLDRKVVCELQPIEVTAEAPRPKVVIVTTGGRKITGRPKQTDPFAGLSRQLEH